MIIMIPYSCQNLKQLLEQGKALKVGFYAFSSGIAGESTYSLGEEHLEHYPKGHLKEYHELFHRAQLFTGPSKGTKLMVKSVF